MQTSLDMTGHNINNVRSIGFTHLSFSSLDSFCSGAEDEGRTFLDKDQGLYLCRDGMVVLVADSGNSLLIQEKTMGWHGMLVDKPVCAAGTGLQPKIYVGQAMLAAGEEAPSISAFQAWATEHSDTQWQVHLRLKTTTHADWVYPSITYGRVEVTTTCAR
jgi:tRNA U34 5-carboxymethylaminomethyl modifying enzyme MnmG/GidA